MRWLYNALLSNITWISIEKLLLSTMHKGLGTNQLFFLPYSTEQDNLGLRFAMLRIKKPDLFRLDLSPSFRYLLHIIQKPVWICSPVLTPTNTPIPEYESKQKRSIKPGNIEQRKNCLAKIGSTSMAYLVCNLLLISAMPPLLPNGTSFRWNTEAFSVVSLICWT